MVRDDFNSSVLDGSWAAVNLEQEGPAFSLTANPGNLQITVPNGRPYDQWTGIDNAAEIYRADMGAGNFALETSLTLESFTEGTAFMAGIAIRFGAGDLLLWGPAMGSFQLEAVRSGSPGLAVFRGFGSHVVFLRVEKSGHVYSFFHKAAASDRWVADGQYRPADAAVRSVGVAVKTWTDTGASLTVSFDYFSFIIGTRISDIGQETGDARSFGNVCTRWVPAYGPLISIPPNIPGQATGAKNVRFILPDRMAYDRTAALDTAPQLYRIDFDAAAWSLETVVTMVYSDQAIARAGLFLQFTETDVLVFGLSGDDSLTLYRSGTGDIAAVNGFPNRIWLRITHSSSCFSFDYKTDIGVEWNTLTSLAESAIPQRGGVIVCTVEPANAAFDFGYLHLQKPLPGQTPVTAPIALPAPPPSVLLPVSDETAASLVSGLLILENEVFRLEVDAVDGTIHQVINKAAGVKLMNTEVRTTNPFAWRIETEPGSEESSWLTPTDAAAVFKGTQYPDLLDMVWNCSDGLTVHAVAWFDSETSDIIFGVEIINTGSTAVATLEYPRIDKVDVLGAAGACDYLLHSFATGFLFKNPVQLFPEGGGLSPTPYPECFNGAPAQLMAYYRDGIGGFGFWIDDAAGWVKWMDCFKPVERELLTVRFLHSAAGIQPGNGLVLPYTVRVAALSDGTWYEAAERYRTWAREQVFCALGPLHSRSNKADWLLEKVGLATFGISTQYDRRPWLTYFHNISGQPVFHITGPNWQKGRWDYLGNQNGGTDGVFPHAVIPSYLETVNRQGDYFAAFSFGTLFSDTTSADYADAQAAYQQIPGRVAPGLTNTLSRDAYDFPFLCPAAGALTRLCLCRDVGAVRQLGANAIYYDIGPNNVMLRCQNPDHGHPVGGGSSLTDGYKQVLASVREAAQEAASAYIPFGCELVNEVFIPYMDFYQARAEASPSSSFEAWPFYDWIKQGQCEKIPLFAFLYHEYGPTRLDGWGHLDSQQNDLFYWIAGRVYAWGGIYELNDEFSSLDVVDGERDDITQAFSSFAVDRYYPIDEDKVAFLSRMAIARTTYANKYLAYGEMMRPLPLTVPQIEMEWFHFNSPPDSREYQEMGTMTVSSVLQSSWRYRTESYGYFFVNLGTGTYNTTITIDPAGLGLTVGSSLHAFSVTASDTADLGVLTGPTTSLPVSIPGRSPLLIEVRMI